MTIPSFVDGVTDLDAETLNRLVDAANGLADGTVPIALAGIEDALREDAGNGYRRARDYSGTATEQILAAAADLSANGGGDILFLISNVGNPDSWSLVGTVASGAANTPGTTAALTRYARVTTLTNATRSINLSRITHYHER